jgi:biotin transport system substrate-specific component
MKTKLSIKEITLIGMCAALMVIFSQIAIPVPFTVVPITLQVFGIVLLATITGKKIAPISLAVFACIGAIGLPVFSNFSGGFGVIAGPKGGYIIGFIVMAFIIGLFSEKDNKVLIFVGAYIGTLVDYIFGVAQLMFILNLNLEQALVAGFYPFVIKDIIIIPIAVFVALAVKKSVAKILVDARA